MVIYLDTVLWNRLCDQQVDAACLVRTLAQDDARLALGTEAVYELAGTFQGKDQDAYQRGKRLFSYLRTLTQLRTHCVQITQDLLADEAHIAQGTKQRPEVFLDAVQYGNLEKEVEKLSRGVFDLRADGFLKKRKAEAENTRSGIAAHYQHQPRTMLLKKMAAVPRDDVSRWISKELQTRGRRVLRWHLGHVFPNAQGRELTWIAKKLLVSSRYRVAQALTRSDLYVNWRFAQSGAMPRDIPSDVYHVVNAAYCDVYATCEAAQAKYVPLVLTKTRFALYGGDAPLSSWLTAVSRGLWGIDDRGASITSCSTTT